MGEILRIKKHSGNFVILDKTFINDKRLSWKARGVLTHLLSRPDNWEVNVNDLVNQSPDGKTVVYSALKELKEYGYYQKVAIRDEKSRIIRWESTISELPMTDQENADSESENDCAENKSLSSEKVKRCTKSENKATARKKAVQKSKRETANSQETKVEQADAELNSSILESNLSKTELKLDEAELELDVTFPYSENLKVGKVKTRKQGHNKELNIINNYSNKKEYCASDDAPSFFETVWNLYPRKRGKAKVSNQQKKHLCEIGQELLRALERYKAELKVESWKQPQNGDTFFTRGYVDYLDNNYTPVEAPSVPTTQPKKNSFTNFEQRSYDWDEMETLFLTTPCPV